MHTANELYHAIGPFLRAVSGERIFDQRPLPEQARDLIWLYDRIGLSLRRGDALHPRAFEVATLAARFETCGQDGSSGTVNDEQAVGWALSLLEEADKQCWERWAEPTPERLREKGLRELLAEVTETVDFLRRCCNDVEYGPGQGAAEELLKKLAAAR